MKTTHTPDTLTQASLTEMASFKGRPCLSLYQPTHRRHPDKQQDPIRFRHLVKALETSLRQQHATDAVKALLEPFEGLAQDHDFWNHTTGRYQVLALSLNMVQLFEGDRDTLDAVALAVGVPQTMTAALGDQRTEPHNTVSSYGGIGGGRMAMHHGQGGKKDEIDGDAERFFRAVDRAVLELHSRPSGLPLMLAALPEHQHRFREASHNPYLIASGLMADPQALTRDDLGALVEGMGGEIHVLPAERMPCRTGVAASFRH